MITTLHLANFTVFPEADLRFSRNLNVIHGANGAGKTHLLKLLYATLAASWEEGKRPAASAPTKSNLQPRMADKLVGVFRPDALGRLTRRKQHERCVVRCGHANPELDIEYTISAQSKSGVSIELLPKRFVDKAPVYLPTRELLTIYPNFVATYEGRYLEFEETWRDTCLLLGAPLERTKKKGVREMLGPLEQAMGGTIVLDKGGRFYLSNKEGRAEMPLVAEGFRKLGMLARLIATGTLFKQGYLFWDEPEANLNARLIRIAARLLHELAYSGVQIFIATHSLFLMRELHILRQQELIYAPDSRYFGLHSTDDGGIEVAQGPAIEDSGDIAALDESLEQAERYLDVESGAEP